MKILFISIEYVTNPDNYRERELLTDDGKAHFLKL